DREGLGRGVGALVEDEDEAALRARRLDARVEHAEEHLVGVALLDERLRRLEEELHERRLALAASVLLPRSGESERAVRRPHARGARDGQQLESGPRAVGEREGALDVARGAGRGGRVREDLDRVAQARARALRVAAREDELRLDDGGLGLEAREAALAGGLG